MIYKGYKIRVRCINWEQEAYLDRYWQIFQSSVASEKLIGLGMNWTEDYLFFDYAIGTINDEDNLKIIGNIDFSKTEFIPEYFEIELPNLDNWQTFRGKEIDLREIYDVKIGYDKEYDYELEYIDGKGNLEIKIHYKNV